MINKVLLFATVGIITFTTIREMPIQEGRILATHARVIDKLSEGGSKNDDLYVLEYCNEAFKFYADDLEIGDCVSVAFDTHETENMVKWEVVDVTYSKY